jgi:hypothetical protein
MSLAFHESGDRQDVSTAPALKDSGIDVEGNPPSSDLFTDSTVRQFLPRPRQVISVNRTDERRACRMTVTDDSGTRRRT